jgi:hypothetical protein
MGNLHQIVRRSGSFRDLVLVQGTQFQDVAFSEVDSTTSFEQHMHRRLETYPGTSTEKAALEKALSAFYKYLFKLRDAEGSDLYQCCLNLAAQEKETVSKKKGGKQDQIHLGDYPQGRTLHFLWDIKIADALLDCCRLDNDFSQMDKGHHVSSFARGFQDLTPNSSRMNPYKHPANATALTFFATFLSQQTIAPGDSVLGKDTVTEELCAFEKTFQMTGNLHLVIARLMKLSILLRAWMMVCLFIDICNH